MGITILRAFDRVLEQETNILVRSEINRQIQRSFSEEAMKAIEFAPAPAPDERFDALLHDTTRKFSSAQDLAVRQVIEVTLSHLHDEFIDAEDAAQRLAHLTHGPEARITTEELDRWIDAVVHPEDYVVGSGGSVITLAAYEAANPTHFTADPPANFNNGYHSSRLAQAHEQYGEAIVNEENEVIVAEEYLEGFSDAQIAAIRAASDKDIRVVPLTDIEHEFCQPLSGGKRKRIVIVRQDDLTEGMRNWADSDTHRVLAVENYHVTHLAATVDFARALLTGNAAAVREFWHLMRHTDFEPRSYVIDGYLSSAIVNIDLPSVQSERIDPDALDSLMEQHARLISHA